MKIFKKLSFLFSLVIAINLFTLAFADTVCTNGDCSVGISINVTGGLSAAFAGSVKDLTGELIPNANVTVLGTNHSTVTATGNYNLTGIPAGRYDLIASADEYLSQTRTNQLTVTGIATTINFKLGLVGLLKGNIVDFWTGNGITNSNVTLWLYGGILSSTLTDANGYYEFTNLAPGYYDIYVNAAGYTSNSKLSNQVLGGRNTTVNLWLW